MSRSYDNYTNISENSKRFIRIDSARGLSYCPTNMTKHVTQRLIELRKRAGISSKQKMANLCDYASVDGYAYYEDKKRYKSDYFESSFIMKIKPILTSRGIKPQEVDELGIAAKASSGASAADLSLTHVLECLIALLIKKGYIGKEELTSLLSMTDGLYQEYPLAAKVMNQFHTFLADEPLQLARILARTLAELAPEGSA